jgi:hypothetical protein
VEAAVAKQPSLHCVRLVSGKIVENDMNFELGGHLAVDRVSRRPATKSLWAWVLQMSVMTVPRRMSKAAKRSTGAVALVVVGGPLWRRRQHREGRRGAVGALDLRPLVDDEHRRGVWRVDVQPD